MPVTMHFGVSSELFFFLAVSPHAALSVAGLCQLSLLPVPVFPWYSSDLRLPFHCSLPPFTMVLHPLTGNRNIYLSF